MVPRARPKKKGPRPLEPTSQVARLLVASDRHPDAPGTQMSNLLRKVHTIWRLVREHAREQAGKNTITSFGARIAGAIGSAYFGVDPRLGDAEGACMGIGVRSGQV